MNTNSLDKFSLKINSKQFLAAFLIIILTLIIIFLSFRWKNKVTFEYEGKVLNNNILEITNLSYLDVKTIIDSKLKILDRKITKDNIAIEKIQDKYQILINLEQFSIPGDKLKLNCIYLEESLFQFIKNTMKGEI
ncbi:MAG: hypothetical protein IJ501_04415 [Bacilli bacterium]|nr:hypothetical protein [Bacilli bacterium]